MEREMDTAGVHRCKECKKLFYAWPGYVYKKRNGGNGYKWYCSWHCLRAEEKRTEDKRKRNPVHLNS